MTEDNRCAQRVVMSPPLGAAIDSFGKPQGNLRVFDGVSLEGSAEAVDRAHAVLSEAYGKDGYKVRYEKAEAERLATARQVFELNRRLGIDETAAKRIAGLEKRVSDLTRAVRVVEDNLERALSQHHKACELRDLAIADAKQAQAERRAALKTVEASKDVRLVRKLEKRVASLEEQLHEAVTKAQESEPDPASARAVLCDLVEWANERMREQ